MAPPAVAEPPRLCVSARACLCVYVRVRARARCQALHHVRLCQGVAVGKAIFTAERSVFTLGLGLAGGAGSQANASNSKWVLEVASGDSCPSVGSVQMNPLPFSPHRPLPALSLFLLFLPPARPLPLPSAHSPFLHASVG